MDGFHRSWKTWYQHTWKRTFPCSGVQTSLVKWLHGYQANVLYLCLYLFKFCRFLSTMGFSIEDNFCQSQGIGKLIKGKPWKNVRQLAPKIISPGRFAPSLWTIGPQFLDNLPPVSGQFALKQLIKGQQRSSSILHNLQQLSNDNFYKPLSSPIVQNTAWKAKELVNKLYCLGHINLMTHKWLTIDLKQPHIPEFYWLKFSSPTEQMLVTKQRMRKKFYHLLPLMTRLHRISKTRFSWNTGTSFNSNLDLHISLNSHRLYLTGRNNHSRTF